jgi:hypothetical protein
MSSILNSSIKGGLGCSVECMSNHTYVITQFLLVQYHLHTPYMSTFAERSLGANVEGNMVVAVHLE